jgi:hypothetical protein
MRTRHGHARCDATEAEVFDPATGFGDGAQQSIVGLGFQGGLGAGLMHYPLRGNEGRSRPGSESVVVADSTKIGSSAPAAIGSFDLPKFRRTSTGASGKP